MSKYCWIFIFLRKLFLQLSDFSFKLLYSLLILLRATRLRLSLYCWTILTAWRKFLLNLLVLIDELIEDLSDPVNMLPQYRRIGNRSFATLHSDQVILVLLLLLIKLLHILLSNSVHRTLGHGRVQILLTLLQNSWLEWHILRQLRILLYLGICWQLAIFHTWCLPWNGLSRRLCCLISFHTLIDFVDLDDLLWLDGAFYFFCDHQIVVVLSVESLTHRFSC